MQHSVQRGISNVTNVTTIPYIIIDKKNPRNFVSFVVEEGNVAAFFLGRRIKNYTVVLDEKVAVCLAEVIQSKPELCIAMRLADYLKSRRPTNQPRHD